VIVFRLKEISRLQKNHQLCDTKAIYIQATEDKLISNCSLKSLQRAFQEIKIQRVIGPHLILQANPHDCAEIIIDALDELKI
jgi:hypothetical protein